VASVNASGVVTANAVGSATITVKTVDGNKTATASITVNSATPTYTLSASPTSINFDNDGGSKSVNVYSNTSWNATESASWLTLTGGSGSGNASFSVSADENTSTNSRSANVTLSGGGITVTISVTQSGKGTTPQLSSNADLGSITISGVTLTPAFNKNVTSYTAKVGNDTTSLSITATAADSKATVNITGNTNLKVGANTVKVTVTAEDGTTKVYTIVVTRSDAPDGIEQVAETRAWTYNSTLYVVVPQPAILQVYSLTGNLIKNQTIPAGETTVSLPSGIYIVKIGSDLIQKVIVR
jgi:hypothetical protein